MCIERQVIEHCSPTLAKLKTRSLFNCRYDSEKELCGQLSLLNAILNKKGVYLRVLRKAKGRALIYVYRKKQLFEELGKSEVAKFLTGQGYRRAEEAEKLEGSLSVQEGQESDESVVEGAVRILSRHLAEGEDFPHEIGVFLGYPIGDVIGFIINKGKNSKCTGCWKVYGDVEEAEKMFCKFKKCRDVYMRLWEDGRPIERLTVGA